MERKSWMKRNAMYCVVGIFISVLMFAGAAYAKDGSCIHCGMKEANFGHSWMVIEHDDGSLEGVCSVHCAAVDMALHTHMPVTKITVGDYNTKKQIDADTAFWVIGGDRMGVMTANAKWAFETKDTADAFIKSHGGRPATFPEVMKSAFQDMYEDTLMIQKKRAMMKMKKQ
ncbi:MAG: NosL family protein [Desulforhopalus sp.]|nr:NosL family protein [Desulforhopalus sp.]